jgi:SpoVK/Ycf46/Vps4 family AAA+-type ATPase
LVSRYNIGATNRIQDIDQAILRRMPRRFFISLPNLEQRERVLNLLLNSIVTSRDFDVHQIAVLTRGYSCSDLKELCRNAVMTPVRESIRKAQLDSEIGQIDSGKLTVRPVSMNDFRSFIDCSSGDNFDSNFLRAESLD